MHIVATSFYHLEIFSKKWRSHSVSSPYLSSVINSDSIVYLTIIVCFEDFQNIATTPSMNTYLLVDLEFFMLDIQCVGVAKGSSSSSTH